MATFITDTNTSSTSTKAFRYSNNYILGISFISALGGYLFGFDFAVISGALPFLQRDFGLNAYWEGFATGSLALGAIGGCVVAGWIADKFGRKRGLLVAALIFALSSIAMALSPSRDLFIASRLVAGIGVGMASMLSPMYIAEISPAHLRGRMVAINQLTIVIGILLTNLINYSLRNSGDDAWRWMFGLGFIPSAIFFIGALFLPESPLWLIKAGLKTDAERVLNKIGDNDFTRHSMMNIERSLKGSTRTSFAEVFKKGVLPAVSIGIGLAVFQQLCGINTVFNYAPRIFESIGASQDDQLLQTVFIGGINLVVTIVAMMLVDKIGRRPLMLLGSAGLVILYVVIAQMLNLQNPNVSWFLLSAIGLYGLSLAPVTWVLISEIFPNRVRSEATSIAVISLWIAYFVLVFTFPVVFEKLQHQSFYIYALVCFIGFFFVFRCVKETKGKTLEELENILSTDDDSANKRK